MITKRLSVAPDAHREARALTAVSAPEETPAERILTDLGTLHTTTFMSLSDAMQAHLGFVMRALNMRSAIITVLDSTTQYVLDARDDHGCGIVAGETLPIEHSFCQYVRASGMPLVVADAASDKRVMRISARPSFNIGSYIGVPLLLRDGSTYGTLCVLDPQPRQFTPSQVALMRIVGKHLALLVDHDLFTATAFRNHHVEASTQKQPGTIDEQITVLESVAHDMRNPLSGIQSYVDLFLNDLLGPISDDQRNVLSQMARATRFINRLINDLVDAAEAGSIGVLSEPFDPLALGQSVLDSFRDLARTRGLDLRMHTSAYIPAIVGDADRLRQILANFVSNALRYTPEGHVILHITLDEGTIQFAVEDTGPGISQDDQACIWEKRTRLESKEPGMGLGLYIVRRLVEAMHGTTGVQSEVGEGSTFWVRLPMEGPAPRKFKWRSAT